jgi:membrane protein DedA with SNARE-associated domain
LLGAIFNYWLAMKYGRPFFYKYGRYLLVSHRSMEKADRFFDRHGPSAPLSDGCCRESGSTYPFPQGLPG